MVKQSSKSRKGKRRQSGAPGRKHNSVQVASAGASRCPVARECGACQYIDTPYADQLAMKDARMAELFAEFVSPVDPAGPAVPADPIGSSNSDVPAAPVALAGPGNSVGPASPAAQAAPASSIGHTGPAVPVEPADSANSTCTAGAADIAGATHTASPAAPVGPTEIRPIRGMDDPFHYRNKVTSPFAPGKRGPNGGREILTGMYAAGTHRLVPTDCCLLENEQAQQVIAAIRAIMRKHGIAPYDENKGTGFMRHAIVRVGHESAEVLVTLVTNDEAFPNSKAFCRELMRRCPFVTTIVQNVNTRQTNVILGPREHRLYGPGFILDTLCGLSFRISSQSFYQVNATQTAILYDAAIELARLDGAQRVIDAYCGTGTIGLVAAKRGAAEVIGVDSVESAIRDARENARHNGIENAQFVAADATKFMRELAEGGEHADVVLMDPPRVGSTSEFLDAVARLAPDRVVYVSCNPATQVRDVRHLAQHGYRLEVVQPVDMFPHTDHVECVALMSKAKE